jgi:AP-2 complex subunit alpha
VPTSEVLRRRLNEVLTVIMRKTEVTKSVNRNNAEHCVLFEAVNLIIKQGEASDPTLRAQGVAHLSKFINIREPNIRYLGLECMARVAALEGTGDAIRKQQATIMFSLKDSDISIRRRALDLLFAMCNKDVAQSVVKELLSYLAIADFAIKDEMVLKLAILAERFAPDMRWYVDTVLQLIGIAGDFVSDDIWHRVVQIVTNTEDLQRYAASRMYHALEPASAHETAVKVGGYTLGEFGYLLNDGETEGGTPISGVQQFAALHQHFTKCSVATKCILLSTYAKMQNLYPELRPQIGPIFTAHATVMDPELQQRAVEYLHLPELREEVTSVVLDVMPPFPERGSMLEARLQRAKEETQDKDVWSKPDRAEAKADEEDADGGAGAGSAGRPSDAGDDEAVGASAGAASGHGHGRGAAASGGAGGEMDLLGVMDAAPAPAPAAVDATTVPVTTRIGIDASRGAQVAAWFNALLVKPAGVLYEDAAVQLGCKSKFQGAEGRIAVFVGNKLGVPLVGFKLRVPPVPGVKVEPVGDVATTVGPRAQVQVQLSLESMQPFVEPPALQVSFISEPGTGHAYQLRVPVAVSNFCEQVAMAGPDFKTRWGALAGAPREVTAIIPAATPAAVSMDAAAKALAAVNMAAIDAGAPGATGASSFRTHTLAANGQHISVGCLAMVIPDAAGGVFKVAVRTQHADVSKALMAVLQSLLEV